MKPFEYDRPLFWWYGGKYYMRLVLLRYVPPHKVYVEAFGGAANLLFAKPPADVEIYNDIHAELAHFFRVLRCPLQAVCLRELLAHTLYGRADFEEAFEPLPDESAFEASLPSECAHTLLEQVWCQLSAGERRAVERARRFYVRHAQSFNGAGSTWSRPNGHAPRNRARRAQETIARITAFAERFRHVIVENCHWRDLLPHYDVPNAFWYLDPPYVLDAREGDAVYEHEMSNAEHEALVEYLLTVRHAKVLVSGYQHPIYYPLTEHGWRCDQYTLAKRASGRARHYGLETLWYNYAPPAAQPRLFDAHL